MRGDLGRALVNPCAGLRAACCSQFRVGGVSVRVSGSENADVTLVPSLEPFRVETGVSDISIQVEWVAWLARAPGRELFHSGSVWRLHEDEDGFRFDFSTPILGRDGPYKRLVVDREFRRASLLLSDECFEGRASAAPLEYPLDEVLITHRLSRERAIELHGCGVVGPDGASNLFVGHSGAGKSTTARLWTARPGVEILSDDRIIVRWDGQRQGTYPAEGTRVETPFGDTCSADGHGVLRLRDWSVSRTSHSAQDDKGKMRMYGTPWHGEAAFASPASAPLSRICILEHGNGNVLTRLSQSQAVAELFARSFVPFHGHEYVDSALEFLQDVASSVPCYRYAFEPDQGAVERILEFHD